MTRHLRDIWNEKIGGSKKDKERRTQIHRLGVNREKRNNNIMADTGL